ncbi:hypothetical protein ACJIZ3_025655 [Penstemon smallii]|uniref:Bifunctional lysine-specific demethylase and histidyl-hydroxylase n=1 Tax=Penstemon smallii TaxID=265156 RepID=A0ABD3TV56_9LAMI
MNTRRKITKRRKTKQDNSLFPLILSALFRKSDNNKTLIKKCLNKISLSLPHLLSNPILSLLPSLLKSNSSEIVCKSAEIIGAASLVSFEMNENIALEDDILKGLISLLRNSKREIAVAACNAIMDLSTTLCFIQASKSSTADMLLFMEDEYLILLLQGAIALINSCTTEMLHHIPTELSDAFLVYLKGLWNQVHKQRLCNTSSKCDQVKDLYTSNIGTDNLAESIFRLSIDNCSYTRTEAFDFVKKSIFDEGEISVEQFLSSIWELSPMLIRDGSKFSRKEDDIFGPFIHFLDPKEAIPTFIPSILENTFSCPPIASDELDILHFLNQVKSYLGCPIIYNQDIRVLKTQSKQRETHYFQDTHILHINEILKCQEAFRDGYSIALRGLEFRFQSIAAIADELASFFGQPSVGVNMYLTPPNSQGLARHFDDHCVFICQLYGVKKWTIYTHSSYQLPRLYEPLHGSCGLEAEGQEDDRCLQFLLKEGDILYIPRGFPHEAHTIIDDDECYDATEFSLHLTLAVEIEPPCELEYVGFLASFEGWEGFMQVALYSWNKKQEVLQNTSGDSIPQNLDLASVKLLHISIKLLGNLDSTFRKACLVGALAMSSITGDWLCEHQITIFKYLMGKIATESKFSDAIQYVEEAIRKNEDPLEHVRWTKYLTVEGEIDRSDHSGIYSPDCKYLFDLVIQNRDVVEVAFMEVKSKFCCELDIEDVEKCYKLLLERYRKVRKQYTNGMLSLHCNVDNEHEITSF